MTEDDYREVDVWSSFMDLVHVIGAVGCVLLVGGFAAAGDPSRAAFYAVAALALTVALLHRRYPRSAAPVHRVVDLTAAAPSGALELQEH